MLNDYLNRQFVNSVGLDLGQEFLFWEDMQ
jgi:hypothetical protein